MVDDENSRFYLDFSNEKEALVALSEMYEQLLRQKNPERSKVLYSLADLIDFVEKLTEVVLLVYDAKNKGFQPHGKSWIKALILTQSVSQ